MHIIVLNGPQSMNYATILSTERDVAKNGKMQIKHFKKLTKLSNSRDSGA